jgi:hypothetical protein
MLPTLRRADFETMDDAALAWACWEPTARLLRGRSPEMKRAVYEQQSPGRQAFFMVQVLRGHIGDGVLLFLETMSYILERPDTWPALRSGFAFFGGGAMVELLAPMEALFRKVQALGPGAADDPEIKAAARAIDERLPEALAEALRLVAEYIRSHAAEFVRLEEG